MSVFSGRISKNLLFRIANRLSGYRLARYFFNSWYSKDNLLAIQNFIECEAHRELLIKGIKGSYIKRN